MPASIAPGCFSSSPGVKSGLIRYTRNALELLNATRMVSDGDACGHVDGTGGQPDRVAVLGERDTGGVDAKRGDVMLGTHQSVSGYAAAGRDVQIPPRDVQPGVLHASKQGDSSAPGQR